MPYYAANGLRKAGDRRAVQPLLPLLAASDAMVRTAAVHALGELGDESVLPRMREIATDDQVADNSSNKDCTPGF